METFGRPLEQIFFSTGRIVSKKTIGTGFFVAFSPAQGVMQPILISNRHVFQNVENEFEIAINPMTEDHKGPILGNPQNLAVSTKEIIYHPDPNVDLACIPAGWVAENKLFVVNITPDLFYDFSTSAVFPGDDVYFVGYPENRFDTMHNLPILRKGCVASLPWTDFNRRPEFIIDAQVFPGSSGSPVIARVNNEVRLIGVVSQTMIKNNELRSVPSVYTITSQEVIGLGVVIKSFLIHDLLKIVNDNWKKRFPNRAISN